MTWDFDAPSARNSASSLVRCATMIEKVFRIRKVPTTRATAAKTSRKVVMKDSPCCNWSLFSAATWASSAASKSAGRVAWISSRSALLDSDPSPVTAMSLKTSAPPR